MKTTRSHDPHQSPSQFPAETAAPIHERANSTEGLGANQTSTPSPARALQGRLSAGLSDPPVEKKWPRSATVAFVIVTCGAFWALVYWGVSTLLRK